MGQKWAQISAQQGKIAAGESQISGEANGQQFGWISIFGQVIKEFSYIGNFLFIMGTLLINSKFMWLDEWFKFSNYKEDSKILIGYSWFRSKVVFHKKQIE